MRYLVQWSPYTVLKILEDGETCDVPDGCDIVKQPLEYIQEKFEKWEGEIDWDLVMGLYKSGNFLEIFKLHNSNQWSEDHYCCDKHRKNVIHNVGLWENSRL